MKKAAAVISLILVLVSCLILPTVAASNGWYTNTVTFTVDAYSLYNDAEAGVLYTPGIVTSGSNVQWNLSSSHYYQLLLRPTNETFSIQKGDIVSVPYIPGGFGGWFGGASNSAFFRWSVVEIDAYGYPVSIDGYSFEELVEEDQQEANRSVKYVGGANWNFTPSAIDFNIVESSDNAALVLLVDLLLTESGTFSMNTKQFSFGYGNPNDPARPKYDPPSSGSIDNYVDADKELMDKNQAGLNVAVDVFDGFSLSDFASGLTALIAIYNEILPRLGWLNTLISISIALGLFAFIVGIIPSLFNKDDQPKEKGGRSKEKAVGSKPKKGG